MGDDQDRPRIVAQVTFEPGRGLGIEVIGRLVEQQQIGLLEQQPAQRDAAAFAARKLLDFGIIRRAAQRIHRLVDLGIEIPEPLGFDLVLQLRHFVRGFVGIVHGEFVVAFEDRLRRRHTFHDVLAYRLAGIELRLLRQKTHAGALGGPGFSREVLVEPGHDAKQGRLTGTVDAKDADLGVRIE